MTRSMIGRMRQARERMGFGRRKRRPVRPSQWTGSPALIPSLRALIEEQEYSITDVAPMFGVSRERVRQWCEMYKIRQRGSKRGVGSRVWDDALGQFRPGRAADIRVELREQRRSRRQRSKALRVAEQRAYFVETVRELASRLGRTPTTQEMAAAVTGRVCSHNDAGTRLCHAWGSQSRRGVMADIHETCGIAPRPRGGRGHLRKIA